MERRVARCTGVFSKEKVNLGRQREIDLLKAFSIIMMLITHVIDDLFAYEGHVVAEVIDNVLAQTIGAEGFMICMGIGIVYARKVEPKTYAKRGFSLLMVGQLLNLLRFGVVYTITYAVTGSLIARAGVFLIFSSDILQLAGLTFLLLALLERLKLAPWQIFIVGLLMNVLATILRFRLDTGIYALDQLTGLFFATTSESYFPLFHWFLFPAFGMFFGDVLRHVADKTRFYGSLLIPTGIVTAIYYVLAIAVDQPFFTVIADWTTFCHMTIFDGTAQLFVNTALIGVFYFISLLITEKGMIPVNFISKNINRYYCVHYIFIDVISSMLLARGRGKLQSTGAAVLVGLFVIAVTSFIVWLYDTRLAKPMRSFFAKHIFIWYALIILASIVLCVWAESGITEHANLLNDYLE